MKQETFCLRYVNDEGDICKDFVKSVYCKSGLNGKDLHNEIPETLSSFFFFIYEIVVVKIMRVLMLFLAMLMEFQP